MINSVYVKKQITIKHGGRLAKSISEFDEELDRLQLFISIILLRKKIVIEFYCLHALSK